MPSPAVMAATQALVEAIEADQKANPNDATFHSWALLSYDGTGGSEVFIHGCACPACRQGILNAAKYMAEAEVLGAPPSARRHLN